MQRGDVIQDRFEIERLVGAGGMGVVYRARDRTNGTPVAVKMLQSEQSFSEERFLREAQVLADLSHPAIVAYVASGMAELHRPYIAMEWLEGQTLWKRLEKELLGVRETLVVGMRIAQALGVAHAVGVVHRDVKPSNVFLVDGKLESAKLLDFGLARPYANNNPLTVSGTVLGTPEYMAPEQVQGRSDLDPRADVYGLGAMLYRSLTGSPPFRAETLIAILAKILIEDVPRISTIVSGVPAELEDLIHAMLSKSPDGRPRDGSVVAEELARIERQLDGAPIEPKIDRGATRIMRNQKPATVILASGLSEERALKAFVAQAEGQGGRVERALGGYAVIMFDENGSETALHRAEKTLLLLREAEPQAGASIATIEESESAGGAIDRAAEALGFATVKAPLPVPPARALPDTHTIDPTPQRTPAFADLTPELDVATAPRGRAVAKLAIAALLLAFAGIVLGLAAIEEEPLAQGPQTSIAQTPVAAPIAQPVAEHAPAVLFLSTDPTGASVSIGGEVRGTSPLVLRLPAGPIRLDISKDGWEPAKIELELAAGVERVVSQKLIALKKVRKKRPRSHQVGLKPNPFER